MACDFHKKIIHNYCHKIIGFTPWAAWWMNRTINNGFTEVELGAGLGHCVLHDIKINMHMKNRHQVIPNVEKQVRKNQPWTSSQHPLILLKIFISTQPQSFFVWKFSVLDTSLCNAYTVHITVMALCWMKCILHADHNLSSNFEEIFCTSECQKVWKLYTALHKHAQKKTTVQHAANKTCSLLYRTVPACF